jgi:hypothetical protein
VQRDARDVPAVSASDRLAEDLDVVVAALEEELVERLLERPDSRGTHAADGSSKSAGAIYGGAQDQQL